MPDYVRPANFNSILRDLTRRVAALENGVRASRTTVRNGLLVIADDEGRTTLAVGKQPDGTVSLRVFDPVTGAVRLRLGEQPDGTYSMQALDPSTGVAQVTLGQLLGELAGSYGLEQYDPDTGRRVPLSAIALGTTMWNALGFFTTSSTAWVRAPGVADVPFDMPSTGSIEAHISARMQVAAAAGGYVGVSIDGTTPGFDLTFESAAAAIASVSTVARLAESAGAHTMGLRFTTNGGSVTFQGAHLMLKPY